MVIGRIALMDESDALKAKDAADKAWDNGTGEWPQLSLAARISAIETLVARLKLKRAEIISAVQWEIC
jgi:glyceraldehyde-3-phosphate dehydrogenase (NADP+)